MKKFWLILSCTILLIQGYAQNKDSQLPMPEVPLTPEAAAFKKYGDVPLNHATGAMSFSVPIYNLKYKSYAVPISLSYTGSGFRVDEIASDVGLGWTLQGGGMISQSIRGLRDLLDGSSGFETVNDFLPQVDQDNAVAGTGLYRVCEGGPCETFMETDHTPDFQDQILFGNIDAEPDLFSFNFPGMNGKFFMNNSGEFVTQEASNLIIQHSATGFTILNEDGVLYTFSEKELLTTESTCNGINLFDTNRKLENYSPNFYLTSICLPEGGCINYEYVDYSYKYYTGISQTDYDQVSTFAGARNVSTCYNEIEITEGKKLARIYTDQGVEVHFNYESSHRSDLPPALNSLASGRLSRIEIIVNSQLVNAFDLTHNYSSGRADDIPLLQELPGAFIAAANKRLMLREVQERGKNPYSFTYQHDVLFAPNNYMLPSRYSKARDYWGYYNGAHDNGSLVPVDNINGYSFGDADRSPNENYMKANILRKIIYPTGGETHLDFEAHQRLATVPPDSDGCYETVENHEVSLSSVGDQGPQNAFIGITANSFDIRAVYSTNVPYENTTQIDPVHGEPYSHCVIYGQQPFTHSPFNEELNLAIGTHELVLETAGYIDQVDEEGNPIPAETHISISWKERILDCNSSEAVTMKLVYGGLRLKSQADYPTSVSELTSDKPGLYKYYEYSNEFISINNDMYASNNYYEPNIVYHLFDLYQPGEIGGTPNCNGTDPYFGAPGNGYYYYKALSSESLRSITFANGSPIYYGEVIETHGKDLNNVIREETGMGGFDEREDITGKIVYTFKNYDNIRRATSSVYTEDDYSFLNGELVSKSEYLFAPTLNQFRITKRTDYSYQTHIFDPPNENYEEIFGLKVSRTHAPFLLEANSGGCQEVVPKYDNSFYKLISVWRELKEVKEITYDISSVSEKIVTEQRFTNNLDNLKPYAIESKIDESKTSINYLLYSTDLTGTIYTNLRNRNMVGIPIYNVATLKKSIHPNPEIQPIEHLVTNISRSNFGVNSGRVELNSMHNSELSQPRAFNLNQTQLDAILNESSSEVSVTRNQSGKIIETEKNGEFSAYIWDANNLMLIAQVNNAHANQVFFEGFEDVGVMGEAKAGNKYLPSGSYTIPFTPQTGDDLLMSYWYWNGASWQFSGEQSFAAVINSSGSKIDNVRVYPPMSSMTTFDHQPGVGIISKTDVNGITSYYEYDDANRLEAVFDNDSNLIKLIQYNYTSQN